MGVSCMQVVSTFGYKYSGISIKLVDRDLKDSQTRGGIIEIVFLKFFYMWRYIFTTFCNMYNYWARHFHLFIILSIYGSRS